MLARCLLWLIAATCLRAQLNEGHYYLRSVPNISVRLITGEQRSLHDLLRQRVRILTFFSARCAGLCSPYLLYAKQALGTPTDFAILVLSFDPRDDLEAIRQTAWRLGLADAPSWLWGTAPATDIAALLSSIGYTLRYDTLRSDYDHTILLTVLDERGNILRRMEGFQDPLLFRELAREARGEFVLSYPIPTAEVALRCFELDKAAGTWCLSTGMALLLLPPVTSLLLASVLHAVLGRSRRRRAAGSPPHEDLSSSEALKTA
jgi:cytochrome oxidase Cu insertion factor (SCO1/SenC/PrrC family)